MTRIITTISIQMGDGRDDDESDLRIRNGMMMMISLLNPAGGRQTKGIKADNLGFCLDIRSHSWTAWPVTIMIVITNYIEVGAQQGLHIIYMQYRISGIWTSSYLSGHR